MKICSIILLAGDSLRFKYLTPKQYFKHNNEILVNYSIKKFNQNKLISNAFHRHYFPQLINKKPRKISVRLIKKIINLTKNI